MKNIPVLHVEGKSLAESYERALVRLSEEGLAMKTQYDKSGVPPSIDATMNITILEPYADPMIHKAFPGGIEDLREYALELCGAKDHWMKNMNDPEDTRWEYTYHWRLHDYGSWKERGPSGEQTVRGPFRIDQIESVVRKLASAPYTRQAQMITWMPNLDLDCYDPPCLQSLHYRLAEEDESGVLWLNCNVRFRSNDAWGASFMNMFGFIQFNREVVAKKLGDRIGKQIELGRMNWHADSYHVYGKDLDEFKRRFLDRLGEPFEKRVYNFFDPVIQEIYLGSEESIRKKIREYDERRRLE